MAKYKIHRWDPVTFGNNVNPFPTIYIKPDQEFLDFAKENKYTVIVKIEGTDTIYDGHAMIGIVDSSKDMPNCRPNFFKDTDLYTIALYGRWYEYPLPNKLGTAVITGLKGKYKAPPVHPPPFKPPVPVQEYYEGEDNCAGNLSNMQSASILIVMLVLFGVLIWISTSGKKK